MNKKALILALSVAMLTGCGGTSEKAPEKEAGAEIKQEQDVKEEAKKEEKKEEPKKEEPKKEEPKKEEPKKKIMSQENTKMH
ncbi:hypothetical protein [Anaerococcus tetradius]|uniref:Lipoprotein n=1 Tax=Anaerococcus tetradius TaxID=33036 RepID=A0A133KD04_9FIRM|nr:hypothetical protein [Anaerococcus tetradius]KWZ77452.1 hypothetical protein HMPREF3200_01445 [Anaerococcus tetradius]